MRWRRIRRTLRCRFSVSHTLVQGTATVVDVRVRDHSFRVDEPGRWEDRHRGQPGEYALAALGSCQVITYSVLAAKLGIALGVGQGECEGDLDLHGFFRVLGHPPGFHRCAG